ncbi:CPBP family intramembrane glutamic endopeptidase [Otariodibacter oris]|uniref:CAAX prenyl protease 2/Lysostaphin resistance protein A-like domain-containing protein n=1 Tax=Otariodibacter oris TaxID=1032623 RepID=A0A420XGB8_9PAST|nr:type II CAAX endopeptidase family protein [Otariodibacter oris]QGM80342.1 hypothetical protein A6A10_02475 [Otariodibacter oris]RKR71711.1 hypothetical protein DES31_1446 [Otariodibacter oris]
MFTSHVESIQATSKVKLIVIPLIIALLCVVLIPLIAGIGIVLLMPQTEEAMISPSSTLSMILNVLLSLLVIRFMGKVKLSTLGLTTNKLVKNILIGIFGGFLAITVVTLLIAALGGIDLIFNFKPEYLGTLILGVIFFAFQGTFEELIYRGYLMPYFSKAMKQFWAIIITSILFMLMHGLNPNMTALPVINLMLASVVFSLIYVLSGNLLLVGFAHGTWNYLQGFFYGSEVSGNHIQESVFTAIAQPNKDLISGGGFGFEGGIITSLLGVILIILLGVAIKKKHLPS